MTESPLTFRDALDCVQRRWPEVQSRSSQSPIILLASGFRSGSTLFQRMLSRDCLMWGEPYGDSCLFDSVADIIRRIRNTWPEDSFFYEGQSAQQRADSFIANLYPTPQTLLDSYCSFFETMFAAPAKQANVARWGIKDVRCSADHACLFHWLFPQAKLLFLIRNPYDAFRSYASILQRRNSPWYIRWPDKPLDVRDFGKHWHELASSFVAHHDELNARLIRYEDLVSSEFTRQDDDVGTSRLT